MPHTAGLPDALARRIQARASELGPFGARMRWMPRAGSTNDEAARWALEGAPEGAWVVADEQTAGRGRRGRAWASPPGAGLYLSVIFRPATAARAVSNDPASQLLTLMAGVAAVDALRRATGVPVALKWPNDVVVASGGTGQTWPARDGGGAAGPWRKVAGILAEGTSTGSVLQFVVLGIGVNLRSGAWPADVRARATSLEEMAGRAVDRDAVLVELLASLAEQRARLLGGGSADLLERWRAYAPSCEGRRVRWTSPEGPRSGTTAGVDNDGALLVRTDRGTERIVAGELFWE